MNQELHDTVDRIARFLEREDTRLPERITNHMILIALREERDARRREISGLSGKVDAIVELLEGPSGRMEAGLSARVAQLDRFRTVVLWVLSAVTLAFLGGAGSWLLELLIN